MICKTQIYGLAHMTLQANLFASDRSQAKNLVYKSDVYKYFCKTQGLLTGIGLHKNLTEGFCDSVICSLMFVRISSVFTLQSAYSQLFKNMRFACVRKALASFDLVDCKFRLFFNVFEAHGAGASMYVVILLILRRRPHNNYNTLLNSFVGVF